MVMKESTKQNLVNVVKTVDDMRNKYPDKNIYQVCELLHMKPYKYFNAKNSLKNEKIDIEKEIAKKEEIKEFIINVKCSSKTLEIIKQLANRCNTDITTYTNFYVNSIKE